MLVYLCRLAFAALLVVAIVAGAVVIILLFPIVRCFTPPRATWRSWRPA